MRKTKWHYGVARSMFGDLWVGKTKLPLETAKVFDNIKDAIDNACMYFEEAHPEFDTVDEDVNDEELQNQYENIINSTENTVEEIRPEMKKFLV